MDREPFGKITSNCHKARVDRFIAPRDVITDLRTHRKRRSSCCQEDLDIWFTKNQQKKNYTNYLDYAFGLEPLNSQPEPGERVQTWPCLPRTKSYLSSADSILDLPSYSDAAFPELLDWSNDNILVAALGMKYHKWSWRSQSLISQGLAMNRIYCCKFDPRGELLALGTDTQMTEIHSNVLSRRICMTDCLCYAQCSITALDWSPTGNSFVTGCSSGALVSSTRDGKYIRFRQLTNGEVIVLLRVSPDARYVAVASLYSPGIVLLSWPHLEIYSTVEYNSWTIRTISWHPWRSALLGVGLVTAENRAQISLLDAPTTKVREVSIGHNHHSMDAMLFSHITGELVLSLLNTDSATFPRSCSQLVVMSDSDTVVDRWGEGRTFLDRVRTMVFSPDGTKLATATSDEDLIIWNFLPEGKKRKPKNRRFSAIPVYLDETSYGSSVR